MIRGTTPTITFHIPFDTSEIDALSVAFAQKGEVVINKDLDAVALDGNSIIVNLSETDTLMLDASKVFVEMQIRIRMGDKAMASQIMTEKVERILKDGAI